jgi:hypothetical protein
VGWDECLQGIEIKRLAHKRELAEKTNACEKNLRSNAQNVWPRGGRQEFEESVGQSACAKIQMKSTTSQIIKCHWRTRKWATLISAHLR